MNLMKTIAGVKGEIVSQDDDKTILRLPVTRFGDADSKDLHGEYFDRECYFGDDTVTSKFALYEHLMNPMSNPYAPTEVKAQVLGKATLAKTDDMARWWDFEIRRSNQYHDYILKLNELGYLGTSTQCFPGGKSVDVDGRITDWLEGEVTITPTPADHLLVPKVVELAKSFNLPEPVLAKSESDAPAEQPAAEPVVEAEVTEETQDVDEQMTAIIEGADDSAQPVAEQPKSITPEQFAELAAQVKASNENFNLLKAWVWGSIDLHGSPDEGESLFDVLNALRDLVGSTNAGQMKQAKALTTFAEYVVKELKKGVRDIARESADEQEAQEIVDQIKGNHSPQPTPRYKSVIPEHAPGG